MKKKTKGYIAITPIVTIGSYYMFCNPIILVPIILAILTFYGIVQLMDL